MDNITIGGLYISRWVMGMAAAVAWLVVLIPVKVVVFQVIRHRHPGKPLSWNNILYNATSGPVLLLILSGSFAIAGILVPFPLVGGRIVQAVAIVLMAVALALAADRLALGAIRRIERESEQMRSYSAITHGIVHALIIVLALMVALASLGTSITPLLVVLGVALIAVALALQSTLGKLFSGIYVLTDKPIKVGQYVEIEGGIEGVVDQTNWRSTHIRTLADNIIIVPNSKIAGSIITNYDMPEGEIGVLVPLGVHYKSDLEQVEKITVEVAREVLKEVEGTDPRFDPYVRYHTFGDSAINFTAVLRSRDYGARPLIAHEFIKRLHKRYSQEGIVIPSPTHTLYLKQE